MTGTVLDTRDAAGIKSRVNLKLQRSGPRLHVQGLLLQEVTLGLPPYWPHLPPRGTSRLFDM